MRSKPLAHGAKANHHARGAAMLFAHRLIAIFSDRLVLVCIGIPLIAALTMLAGIYVVNHFMVGSVN